MHRHARGQRSGPGDDGSELDGRREVDDEAIRECTFTAQPLCKSKILWLDGDMLRVNGSQAGISILKQGDKVSFCGPL